MVRIIKINKIYKAKGLKGIIRLIINKFSPSKKPSPLNVEPYLKYFEKKKGLEIGGPSSIFLKEIPLYKFIETLDGCNFNEHTIWEGNINEGYNYNYFENKKGFQYICEASDLKAVPNEKYDFLMASHCLEHCANTLKTVEEWLRVIKKGGALLLILPDKKYTFDHKRSVTPLKHLLDDYNKNIDETDLTHLEEILELHDLNLDLPAGTKDHFKNRSLDNYKNRCLHHHVFDFELLKNIFSFFNIEIIKMTYVEPFHQIVLGVKK